MPLLSICIPTHNRAALLTQSLSELCAIRWPFETEIVVSDNASTDDTPRVLASFPVRAIRQREKLDALDSYFAAMRAARGEYAFYVGDDDGVIADALVRAIAEMQTHPEWIASFSPYLETEQGTDRVLHTANEVDAPFVLGRGDFVATLRFLMLRTYHPETPLVRADAFLRFVTRPVRMWHAHWLLGCMQKQGAIGMLGEPTWKHRVSAPLDTPQVQWTTAVDEIDRSRLGLEYIAFLAQRQNGGKLPEDLGSKIVDFFVQRFADYAEIALRICHAKGDLQGAAEFSTRLGLWRDISVTEFGRSSLEARVDAEIAKRRNAMEGAFTVVETAGERLALLQAGTDARQVVAREDLRLALAVE